MENPASKQLRPWLCGIWSGSALFAYDPFMGFQVRMGQLFNYQKAGDKIFICKFSKKF